MLEIDSKLMLCGHLAAIAISTICQLSSNYKELPNCETFELLKMGQIWMLT